MAENGRDRRPLLRQAEQACAASILIGSLVVIACCTLAQRQRKGLIDLEQPYERRQVEFQVDINSANAAELRLLPGVGSTIARRIIASRRSDGPFRSLDDLRRVRGIGPRTVERIKPYLLPVPPAEDVAEQ